ncbi:hypothetical protein ACOMHN_004045 [Nucella lapillus]
MKNCNPFLKTRTIPQPTTTTTTTAMVAVLVMIGAWWGAPQGVEAFPGGADPSACTTMEPRHGPNTASTLLSPYVVLVSKSTYSPGDTVSVMLRGLCGTQFMGFLAQSRRADPADPRYRANPSQAVGTFRAVAGSQYLCGQVRT